MGKAPKQHSITMHPVESSNVTHIGHGGDRMRVTFSSGGTYEYQGCCAEDFNKLMASDSKGKHLRSMGLKGIKLENPE